MRHAVLGAGAIGGLVGGLLSNIGHDITLIVRPKVGLQRPESVTISTPSGKITAPVRLRTILSEPVDVLWIATKATQLDQALALIKLASPAALVIPLLNGIEHLARLRKSFGESVLAATIFVESERVKPWQIVQKSAFRKLSISGNGAVASSVLRALREAEFDCQMVNDEVTMLWHKLCFLAPFALTTSASDKTCGEILGDEFWLAYLRSAIKEACAVATAEGAIVSEEAIVERFQSASPAMRSSMQKDVAAGVIPELDAIAGPIIRGSLRHGLRSSSCQYLARLIEDKLDLPDRSTSLISLSPCSAKDETEEIAGRLIHKNDVEFRHYEPQDAEAFRNLNEEWILKHFRMEDEDHSVLNDPEAHIIEPGGHIFMAVSGKSPIGCCALISMGPGVFELAKMTVAEQFRGQGIGSRLLAYTINEARRLGAKSLFLGSNRKLSDAIHLYEVHGFRHLQSHEVPSYPYTRADVFMDLKL